MKAARILGALTLAALALILSGCATSTAPGAVGVQRSQLLIVPAGQVTQLAETAFRDQNTEATKKGTLVRSGPELERLQRIADRLIAQAPIFRNDTASWNWEVVLIDEPVINATCYPGGKITFYTGIVRQLKLTDGEIAAVMGHEICHALREHGREKMSQTMLQQGLAALAVAVTDEKHHAKIAGANLFATVAVALPYSREMELEADKMGMELMARAGFDPRDAVTMQEKLARASEDGAKFELLSTHPVGERRVRDLAALVPTVMPFYEASRADGTPAERTTLQR